MTQFAPGIFAYQLHGLIMAPTLTNRSYQPSRVLNFATLFPRLAATDMPQPPNPSEISVPVIAGFGSSPFSFPSYTLPILGVQAAVGLYPVSEIGYMIFRAIDDRNLENDRDSVSKPGSVVGALRINFAGFANPETEFALTGLYKYNDFISGAENEPGLIPYPSGIISTTFTNSEGKTSFSDYSFVVVSNDEIMLESAARHPRPGVLSGTMKRLK